MRSDASESSRVGDVAQESIYASLGIRTWINADTTISRLGGSLMPDVVLRAMIDASRHFVDMMQLEEAVGREIARMTHNDAALVCSGAAAGLYLATLACITGADERRVSSFRAGRLNPSERREIVLQSAHRSPYGTQMRTAGAVIVEVGGALDTEEIDLVSAISDRTAAVAFMAGDHFARGSLPLETVIEVAHAAGVPVIVDAAAQLPPRANLWRFTQLGADLVIFSGGKQLRGPQCTGLIVGREDLVRACSLHAAPRHGLGRAMKVGKEEVVGLLAAVRWYLAEDEAAELDRCERVVERWRTTLSGAPGVVAERSYPGEAGRHLPRLHVRTQHPCPLSTAEAVALLRDDERTFNAAVDALAGRYLPAIERLHEWFQERMAE